MTRSLVRSTLPAKLSLLAGKARTEGPSGVLSVIRASLRYHLRTKWQFVYFEFLLTRSALQFPIADPPHVRIATLQDREQIDAQLFPILGTEASGDRRYFELLGRSDVKCFLAERDGRLVHYSWVFLDVFRSPMVDVPFDRTQLRLDDVYLGPVFTHPGARGFVYLHVLSEILAFLRGHTAARRVLVLVAGDNTGAVGFYKRMGFLVITNPEGRGLIQRIWKRLLRWGQTDA